jgi:hypothetical protein
MIYTISSIPIVRLLCETKKQMIGREYRMIDYKKSWRFFIVEYFLCAKEVLKVVNHRWSG